VTKDRLSKARTLFVLTELSLQRGRSAARLPADRRGAAAGALAARGARVHRRGAAAARPGARGPIAMERWRLPRRSFPTRRHVFLTSIQLLETAQYESDLSLTYAAYGLYLLDQRRFAEGACVALRQASDTGAALRDGGAAGDIAAHHTADRQRTEAEPGPGQVARAIGAPGNSAWPLAAAR